ncbi:hypothetical protein IRJ41_021344, partial [Triplophysa rosa]
DAGGEIEDEEIRGWTDGEGDKGIKSNEKQHEPTDIYRDVRSMTSRCLREESTGSAVFPCRCYGGATIPHHVS